MQHRNYKHLLYFISAVIIVTLAIQVYWNYKNYQTGKQQLINEVQAGLDNAVDSYFVDLADRNTMGFSMTGGNIAEHPQFDSIIKKLDISNKGISGLDSLTEGFPGVRFYTGQKVEMKTPTEKTGEDSENDKKSIVDSAGNGATHGSLTNSLKLASQVIISITTDTLDIASLNHQIEDQFQQKNLQLDYGYVFENKSGDVQEFNTDLNEGEVLSTRSKSAYLPKESTFKFFFTNETSTILKRNLLGIFLSALLIAAVIACLLFLLRIINRQKQLAELKNDLISNITHEFKTPISTAKVALEGIENFNQENDPVKTRNYLQVSNIQLNKLQLMVEKLLETATLDGGNLELNREEVSLVPMLSDLVEKHRQLATNKTVLFKAEQEKLLFSADPFHLENALNNVLDNAVKYGGDEIEVFVSAENELVKIRISDNGTGLTKAQADQVFDKFYRVPKGNTHDVKGFGIGLYYTRNIIEKHGGSIRLHLNHQTSFIITLPENG